MPRICTWFFVFLVTSLGASVLPGAEPQAPFGWKVEQLTFGPQHHFFGYIGQSLTTPWNQSGRYIISLRTTFHDRMPSATDAAEIVLIDTQAAVDDRQRETVLDSTRAWNFQQGTMFYWHPLHPETQFFFNDRDPQTQRVFTVLYDLAKKRRVREYRFDGAPAANGGVSPTGEYFLAINYGRMARLRPVTGYPGAADPTAAERAPDNDGIFRVDIQSGKRRLLVSFAQLRELLSDHPEADRAEYYINHTLCSRDGKLVYFFTRASGEEGPKVINSPCSIGSDGSGLTLQAYIGGHPEWDEGSVIIGVEGKRQVRYDVRQQRLVGQLGEEGDIPSPGADISLSADANWFANGYTVDHGHQIQYVVLRRSDGAVARSPRFSRGPYTSGDLRIDPAPRWNRQGDALLVPGVVSDGTRQLHLLRIIAKP